MMRTKRGKTPGKGKRPLKTAKNGRTKRGRFAVGNKGGPGRPRKGSDAAAYADQAISAEEVWRALAKQIRKGSITAMRTYLEYRHGRPWTEAELLEQKEIDDAQRRIEEARRRNGNTEKATRSGSESAGGPVESDP